MGCVIPRSDITAEEATSHNLDLMLGYSQIPIEKYYKSQAKLVIDDKISDEQFEKLKTKLNIKGKNPDVSQQISNFYQRLKVDISNFDAKKLTALAVLLCQGTDECKGQIFYKGIIGKKSSCNVTEASESFDILFDSCLSILTGLHVKDEINNLTPEDLRRFALKLRQGKKDLTDMIILRLFDSKPEITEEEFIRRVRDRMPEGLFSGNGIRKLLKEKVKSS